jgi:hypothetical protein
MGMKETEVVAAAIEEQPRELKLVDSASGALSEVAPKVSPNWLRVGVVAAGSAVLGGMAAAWFFRKTISRLREAGNEIPESRITEDGSAEDF